MVACLEALCMPLGNAQAKLYAAPVCIMGIRLPPGLYTVRSDEMHRIYHQLPGAAVTYFHDPCSAL